MRVEHVKALLLHLQKRRAFATMRQVAAYGLSEDVMRTRKIGELGAILVDQAVPVGNAGIEGASVPAQRVLHGGDQLGRLLGGDFVGRVVEHPLFLIRLALVGQRDEVGTDGRLVRLHLDAHTQRLQRTAAAGIGARIIAHDGKVRRVAFRRHPLGDGIDKAVDAHRGKVIHIRLLCRFHRRFSFQTVTGFVGHAVADQNDIFHDAMTCASYKISLYIIP